jgi:hypothetical protein
MERWMLFPQAMKSLKARTACRFSRRVSNPFSPVAQQGDFFDGKQKEGLAWQGPLFVEAIWVP